MQVERTRPEQVRNASPCVGDPAAQYRPEFGIRGSALVQYWAGQAGVESVQAAGAQALILHRALELESSAFGRPVRRLLALVAWEQRAAPALEELLGQLLASRPGTAWLCAPAASDDALQTLLARRGFTVAARKVSFLFDGNGAPPALPRARNRVRPHGAGDLPGLLPLAERFGAGQFSGMPGVGSRELAVYYGEWLRRAIDGRFADQVLVAESGGRPVGFLSCKRRPEVERLGGPRVLGHALGAVQPRSSGALLPLLTRLQEDYRGLGFDVLEFDCYADNRGVVRVLDRLGFRAGAERCCAWLQT